MKVLHLATLFVGLTASALVQAPGTEVTSDTPEFIVAY